MLGLVADGGGGMIIIETDKEKKEIENRLRLVWKSCKKLSGNDFAICADSIAEIIAALGIKLKML